MASATKAKPEILLEILKQDEIKAIQEIVALHTTQRDVELEASFLNVSYVDYMRIVEYYVANTNPETIASTDSLDINVGFPEQDTFRCSLFDTEKISAFVDTASKMNHMRIIQHLSEYRQAPGVELMKKHRGSARRIRVDEIATTFKATVETKLTQAPELTGKEEILYRYKSRNTFMTHEDYKIDISEVKESDTLEELADQPTRYEIEIEILTPKISITKFLTYVGDVLRIVQNTDVCYTRSESQSVINNYFALLKTKPQPNLVVRQLQSMPVHAILNDVANRFAITDKADGERYVMFVDSSDVYLLSYNLRLRKLAMEITNETYQNMILDGEYVTTDHGNVFLIFDVIYAEGVDYRTGETNILTHRIGVMNRIVDRCFNSLIAFPEYIDRHEAVDLPKIRRFYQLQLEKYWSTFRSKLSQASLLVTRKIYFVPYGVHNCEVFMYHDMLWKALVYQKMALYHLDGIVYSPMNAAYFPPPATPEYKWKPVSQNSIDFYIRFRKNDEGEEIVFYDDNTLKTDTSAFKIMELFVGHNENRVEKPVPFKVNSRHQYAYIYLTDGEARDMQGRIVNDETVVEMVFDNTKADIDDAYKWQIIKTRYDKTESVQKYGRRYGNNDNIAQAIWKTIIAPVTEEIIVGLADETTYQRNVDLLRQINESYTRESKVYYQQKTDNARGMRAFNNWIKSNLIVTYCRQGAEVLDIGCGRGGDIVKFAHANVAKVVGTDVDNHGLYIIEDSALARYRKLRRMRRDVPPMFFIHADSKAVFNVESQAAVIPNITKMNRDLIATHLSGRHTYDVISVQFNVHYYLEDETTWSNFCENLRQHLKPNGYVLITTFDGDIVSEKLHSASKYTVWYTDNRGSRVTFFEIKKAYQNENLRRQNYGLGIDLYNSLISNPNTYHREYLVMPDFLTQSLRTKCHLDLVESDTFENLLYMYRNYFLRDDFDAISGLDPNSNLKRHSEIRDFYKSIDPRYQTLFNAHEIEISQASFQLMALNRYYVFKFNTTYVDMHPARVVALNGALKLGPILDPHLARIRTKIDRKADADTLAKVYDFVMKGLQTSDKATKPSVYLIRHEPPFANPDIIGGAALPPQNNRLQFIKIKSRDAHKAIIIYKSPAKIFYPLQHNLKSKPSYLFQDPEIVKNLEFLIGLQSR